MNAKQKQTLLEALEILKTLGREWMNHTLKQGRQSAGKLKSILEIHRRELIQKAPAVAAQISKKIPHLRIPLVISRRPRLALGLLSITALGITAHRLQPSTTTTPTEFSSHHTLGEHNPSSMNRMEPANVHNSVNSRIAVARAHALAAVEQAKLKKQAAETALVLEKERSKAAEAARQAKAAAIAAQQNATQAKIAQRTRASSTLHSSVLQSMARGQGYSSPRSTRLGYGHSSSYSTSNSHAQEAARRDMQRYQRQMSGIMAARGVR